MLFMHLIKIAVIKVTCKPKYSNDGTFSNIREFRSIRFSASRAGACLCQGRTQVRSRLSSAC